jgi:hypothetical protein
MWKEHILIICEQGAKGNTWAQVGGSNRRLENTANQELQNFYSTVIMRFKMHEACIGETANADNTLVRKPEGNRPLCTDVRIRLV